MIKETKNLTIKPGYKKTPIGINPEEWVVKNFGDFLEFKNGVNASKKDYGKGVKFINVLEVITNLSLTNEEIPGEVEITEKQFERYKVEKGDILFNRTSETQEEIALSSVYLDDCPTVFGGFVIRGRFIKDFYLNAFKKYIFRNPDVRKQMISKGQGAVRVNIGQSDLEKISTPIPPLPEQKAIADCLSTWDKGIEKLTALIQSKKEQKKGLMQGFFSGKLKVENGELIQAKEKEDFTEDWEEVRLKDIANIKKGKQLNRKKLNDFDKYPSYSGGITPSGFTNKSNCKSNTIIISEGGNSCGYVNFINVDFWLGGHCYAVNEYKERAIKRFLYNILKHNQPKIMVLRVGSGLPNVQKGDLERSEEHT